MDEPVLLFSGPPRSGKSTVVKRIAKDFKLKYISIREMLEEATGNKKTPLKKVISLIDDKFIEEAVDTAVELASDGGYAIDGRYEALVCWKRGVFAPAIYITAALEIRAQREADISKISLEEAKKILKEREDVELSFCRRKFNGDYRSPHLYIGMIDTSDLSPGEVYTEVKSLLREKGFLRTPGD